MVQKVTETFARAWSTALVMSMVGENMADEWWKSPNKAFDMQTPDQVWVQDYERIFNYLMDAASGW